jgi:hypothetical protein
MNAHEIEAYLTELGQVLAQQGVYQPVRLLMVGGAYMVTQTGNRPATKDVDVLLVDMPDPTASPLYGPVQAAVRAVAAKHGLPANWLNDVIGDALRNYGPIPPGILWRAFGPLEVYIPPADYIFALKVLAGRPGDLTDAQALARQLGLLTRAQARRIVEAYITDTQLLSTLGVVQTLANLFP